MPFEPLPLDAYAARLAAWAELSSFTGDPAGVRAFGEAVAAATEGADDVAWHELPPRVEIDARGGSRDAAVGPAVVLTKRAGAARRFLLSGHLDTVHAEPWPTARDGGVLRGPGVADMKGGLIVLAETVRQFEAGDSGGVGWTIVLTPDEEAGSASSAALLRELAAAHDVGLVFEPTMEDDALAGARGGSGEFTLVLRGRAAHVGRDFAAGRSALHLACEAVGVLDRLNVAEGVTVNVGKIDGGGPTNVVADLAVVRFNVRVADGEKQQAIENDLRRLTLVLGRRDGVTADLHGGFAAPPKAEPTALLAALRELDPAATWRSTGGVCDGNILAAAGLPNLDTMGVRGGGIHTRAEWCDLTSIGQRAAWAAELMRRLAAGEVAWPGRVGS